MPDLSLNPATVFYATSTELALWISEWKQRHQLHWSFCELPPSNQFAGLGDQVSPQILKDTIESSWELYLKTSPFDLNVKSALYIPHANRHLLHILIPQLLGSELRFGSLGSVATDKESLAIWGAVATDLFAKTASGVWYSSPKRKKPIHEKAVRYSKGAALLWQAGTKLVGGEGSFASKLDCSTEDFPDASCVGA